MTLRTGTSKSGATHRYYTCSTYARQGKTACKGRSIPMAKLDDLVTDSLVDQLFEPRHLTALLISVSERRVAQALEIDKRVYTLQSELADTEEKLKRLDKMVEDGIAELDDILKDRIANLKLDRERTSTTLDCIRAQAAPPSAFDPAVIESFGRAMRENITTGETPFRKAYIRAVIDRIEVDGGGVRIVGDKVTLEQAVAGLSLAANGVRRFEMARPKGFEPLTLRFVV